jgi:hypothetical protein
MGSTLGVTLQQAADAYSIENKTETNEYWTSIELPPITVYDIKPSVGALSKPGLNKIRMVRLLKVMLNRLKGSIPISIRSRYC